MPIQRLFARRDVRTFPLPYQDALVRISDFLRQAQFRVDFVTVNQIHAEQFYQKLGLRRVMDVWVNEANGASTVTIDFSATLGDTETAVGLVGAVLFLPLAVAVGAVSYLDYESDANNMISALWSYLSSAPPAAGTVQRRCGNCGLNIEADSRFCRQCGAQIPS